MNAPAPVALEISLGEDETFGRLHVELAAWCNFETWMDSQVELFSARMAVAVEQVLRPDFRVRGGG